MTNRASTMNVTFHLQPRILWRTSRWRCECGYESSQWTAALYYDDVLVAECRETSLLPMIRAAERWRNILQGPEPVTRPSPVSPSEGERRVNPRERRAVPRGGRRSSDPRH